MLVLPGAIAYYEGWGEVHDADRGGLALRRLGHCPETYRLQAPASSATKAGTTRPLQPSQVLRMLIQMQSYT